MPPSEDEISLGDDEFGVPEDPVEQERFKRRVMATARSLKISSSSSKLIKTCSQTDGLKSWQPRNMDSSAKRLTGHPVVGIKRDISPNTSPHHHADTLRPRATSKTCKIFWKTKQDSQDRSTDHGGVPQRAMMIVAPDTSSIGSAGPNIVTQTNSSCVDT